MRSSILAPLLIGVMVLPCNSESFEQFRVDDAVYQQYAPEQEGGKTLKRTAMESALSSAMAGTVVGAAAGMQQWVAMKVPASAQVAIGSSASSASMLRGRSLIR